MAFTRPTLSTIIDRIKADIKSGLQLSAILRRSFEEIISKALGGASHTLHGHIEYAIENKFFPDTGDDATVLRWSTLYNVPRVDATFAKLVIDIVFTGNGTVPINTIFKRSDGFQYKLESEVSSLVAGTVQGTIIASLNPQNDSTAAGIDGNMNVGESVGLLSPISNVNSSALVSSISVQAENQESIDDLQVRVLNRIQNPPAGGTVADYITFALEVAGITRAWVLPGSQANRRGECTVDVTFVEDGNAPGSIIPNAAKVQEVQDNLSLKAPVPADALAFAPIEKQINPTISIKPNTTAVQAAVQAELEDLIFREAQVRDAYAGVGSTFDGIIALSKINEAISIADGEDDHVLVSPTSDPQPLEGGLLTLGTITFQTLA